MKTTTDVYYLLIDNSDIFSTPTYGDAAGSRRIYWLKTLSDSMPYNPYAVVGTIIIVVALVACGIMAGILLIYLGSKKKQPIVRDTEPSPAKEPKPPKKEYQIPLACPRCNAPLKPETTKIMDSQARCLYCESIFELKEKLS